jgi:hypothetical protein
MTGPGVTGAAEVGVAGGAAGSGRWPTTGGRNGLASGGRKDIRGAGFSSASPAGRTSSVAVVGAGKSSVLDSERAELSSDFGSKTTVLLEDGSALCSFSKCGVNPF